jgi:hypothetical protein
VFHLLLSVYVLCFAYMSNYIIMGGPYPGVYFGFFIYQLVKYNMRLKFLIAVRSDIVSISV